MSPTNDMKARLFVDMDGTLAVWKQAACFEDLLQPGVFQRFAALSDGFGCCEDSLYHEAGT